MAGIISLVAKFINSMPPPHHKEPWIRLSDEDLLTKRIKDLNLKIEGTLLEKYIAQLYRELDEKNITFRPQCYLADEWFVPEDETVIGVPFYLAHPRLKRLELHMMQEVEGGTHPWCMRLLRHETGHAIYYAYQLNKKRKLREIFGPLNQNEPQAFRPKPYSKSFVRHLDNWYAQTDPDEDFAETFAVWLTPKSNWRKHYQGWKALKKLEFMDQLMLSITRQTPKKISDKLFCAASKSKMKLSVYYQRKRKAFAQDYPEFYDPNLKKIFPQNSLYPNPETAFHLLKRNQKLITQKVSLWTGEKKFVVNQLVKRLMERCKDLSLKVCKEELEINLDICAYLTAMVSHYRFTGTFKKTV